MAEKPKAPNAAPFVPDRPTVKKLQQAAKSCTACDLHLTGTQTVFGEGKPKSKAMLVGEQPGDSEDKAGHPFIGPAGKLLDDCLVEAGIDRDEVYVTNVVKHFKWNQESGGKRRIHQKPNAREINACRPWLDAEIQTVKPRLIIALGATAAQTLLGKNFRVTKQRGEIVDALGSAVMATVHPSSILRAPDSETRHRERAAFVEDLKKAAKFLKKSGD